jgi:hypothetical protein
MKVWLFLWAWSFIIFPLATGEKDNSFKILSFTIDGQKVKEYSVTFEIAGKEIVPLRQGNKFIVPKDISETDEVIIKFQTAGYNFGFGPFSGFGRIEDDGVDVDYIVGVDTPPFEPKNLFGYDEKKYQAIYFLETAPKVSAGSKLIIDPIRFTVGEPSKKVEEYTSNR